MPTTVINPKGQVVVCNDGLVVDGGGQICADVCNEECCVNKDNGEDACVGFTGFHVLMPISALFVMDVMEKGLVLKLETI